MFVTICVIAYNEESTLRSVLRDITCQSYNHDMIEVVLVDSASTDGTKSIMNDFANRNEGGFRNIQVLDNPQRTLPCGWNVALAAYSGEAIVKVDAHASIPTDFLQRNIDSIIDDEYVVGGQRPNIIDEATPWKETLLLAESSMFGSSIAPYRRSQEKTYVKSMFHAMYRREVFDTIGVFDERLTRTEDNEIHYRMRKAGYRLCFNPDIISYQHTRSSLCKMLKQKYSNGYWIGLTSGVCPGCLSIYHFVPFAFVVAIIITTIMSICSVYGQPGLFGGIILNLTGIMWAAYWTIAVIMALMSIVTAKKPQRNITNLALPFLFFELHISYGVGTVKGVINMPGWRRRWRNNGTNEKR